MEKLILIINVTQYIPEDPFEPRTERLSRQTIVNPSTL